MRFERLQGKTIMAGDKNDDRHLRQIDLGQRLEAVHFGHLDIQKYEIGSQSDDHLNALRAANRRADDLNVRAAAVQHIPQSRQCGRLVIHKYGANFHVLIRG